MKEKGQPSDQLVISCDFPSVIYPAAVHAGRQQLFQRLLISGVAGKPVPQDVRIALRLGGLVDQPWPLSRDNASTPTMSIFSPPNPAVRIHPSTLDQNIEKTATIEILAGGNPAWHAELKLMPPTAVPTAIGSADLLAVFVVPYHHIIAELVNGARNQLDGDATKIGFPGLNIDKVATVLYSQIHQQIKHFYALEPAPWKLQAESQIVRLPHRVIAEGEATCLDMALLIAAAFERVRRLPILLGLKVAPGEWHVIAGVRKDVECIESMALLQGLDWIRESCGMHKTILVDPEAMLVSSDLRKADELARGKLAAATQAFLVDIQAAREVDIWPLPIAEQSYMPAFASIVSEERSAIEYPSGIPQKLVDEIVNGRTVILVGDILSGSKRRSRHSLTVMLSSEAGLMSSDLLEAGTLIERSRGRPALEQMALHLLDSKEDEDSDSPYHHLAALPVDTVVSFYPDPVLERTLLQAPRPFQVLIDDTDLARLRLDAHSRQLYLLGGSALSKKGLLLTRTDYHAWMRRISMLARGLRERLAFAPFLLLNFDLADTTLNGLYIQSTRHRSPKLHSTYLTGCKNPELGVDFYQVLDTPTDKLLAALAGALPIEPIPILPAQAPPKRNTMRNPYKFLDYFESEDQDLFFGRDEDAKHVLGEIGAAPGKILIICGRSGVGKTSLLKAAVICRLEKSKTDTFYVRSTADPQQAIRLALFDRLSDHPVPLDSSLQQLCRCLFLANHREQLIFVDQFEEALIKLSRPLLHSFFVTLSQCVSDPSLATRFILIVREDFLGQLADNIRSSPNLLSSVYRLDELSRAAARDAILQPAQRSDIEVKDELATAILDDLSADSIMPAHLQIICHQLYQHRKDPGKLTLDDYNMLGRARKILATHLEMALRSMPDNLERLTRAVLRTMVTSHHTRDLLTAEQIALRCHFSPLELDNALHDLIHLHRLVREVPGDVVRFELSHEILAESIASWLDSQEERIRIMHEIIHREYLNYQHFGDRYHLTSDRLMLMDEYASNLELPLDILKFVISELAINARLTKFWIKEANRLLNAEKLDAVIFRPARVSLDALEGLLGGDLEGFFAECNPLPFLDNDARQIAAIATRGSSVVVRHAVQLSLLDSTRTTEAIIIINSWNLSSDRSQEIYQVYAGAQVTSLWLKQAQEKAGIVINPALFYIFGQDDPGELLYRISREANNDPRAAELMKQCVGALGILRTQPYSSAAVRNKIMEVLTLTTFGQDHDMELVRWSLLLELTQAAETRDRIAALMEGALQNLTSGPRKSTDRLLEVGIRRTISLWLSGALDWELSDAETVIAVSYEKAGPRLGHDSALELSTTGPDVLNNLVADAINLVGVPAVRNLLRPGQRPLLLDVTLSVLVESQWIDLASTNEAKSLYSAIEHITSYAGPETEFLQAFLKLRLAASESNQNDFGRKAAEIAANLENLLHKSSSGMREALFIALDYWVNHLEAPLPQLDALLRLMKVPEKWQTPANMRLQAGLGRILATKYLEGALGEGFMAFRKAVKAGFLRTLKSVDHKSYETRLPMLIRCLKDHDPEIRILAAGLLIDSGYEPAIQFIRMTLRDPDLPDYLRNECLNALASADPAIVSDKIAPIFLASKNSKQHFLKVLFKVAHRELSQNDRFIESLLNLSSADTKEGKEIILLMRSWMPEINPTLTRLSTRLHGRARKVIAATLKGQTSV